MQQYLSQLSQSPLFFRISNDDILRAIDLLSGKIVHFEKGAVILHQGTPPKFFGILLKGDAHIISTDVFGNHALLAALRPDDLFATTFVFSDTGEMPVSVVASQKSVVLLLDRSRMMNRHQSDFPAHSLLVANLLRIIANKNLVLAQKIGILSQRTTREKLIAYLLSWKKQTGSSRFVIPFDRQALADYLCVERSAMSAELSKMKKEGLIDYKKNEFEIFLPQNNTKE